MIKRISVVSLVVGIQIALTGCATIMTREYPSLRLNDSVDVTRCYPATVTDLMYVLMGCTFLLAGQGTSDTPGTAAALVMLPGGIIDLPVSLVTATVFLPVDIMRLPAARRKATIETERRSRIFEMTVGVQTTNAPALLLLDTSDRHFDGTPASTKPWATFSLIPSQNTVKATSGTPFGVPNGPEKYKLESVYYDKVWVERLKQ